jgi:hypothetical protein
MTPILVRAALPTLAALVLLVPTRAKDPDEKVPTIKKMMDEAHRCTTAYVKIAGNEARKEDPSWPLVEQKSRELVQIGKWLGQNTPPKGSKESWEQFTNVYVAQATIMLDGALKHDKNTVIDQQKKLYAMCSQCHRAHR